MDKHSKQKRSYNMSRIRSKNTKPEELVRKFLFHDGFRYRKNVRELPGCPDIVLPKYKTVIFVNGCFWHMHTSCGRFVWPQNNKAYWREKIEKNVSRDQENISTLKSEGWNVITIWECELKKNVIHSRLQQLINEILHMATVEKNSIVPGTKNKNF